MSALLNYHAKPQHTGPAQFNAIGAASKQVADIFFEDTTWKAIRESAQNTDFRGKVSQSRVAVNTEGSEK